MYESSAASEISEILGVFLSYWPTASQEINGTFTRIISSSVKFVKSSNPGSLVSVLLILNAFLFHLSCR